MASLQELIAALQRNAEQPVPQVQEQSSLPDVASGLGLGLNLIGAATGKGDLGNNLARFGQQAQALQQSRANQAARAAQSQRSEQGRTLRAILPIQAKEEKRKRDITKAQDIVSLIQNKEVAGRFGLDGVDQLLLSKIAESNPGKVPEVFTEFISNKGKTREFKVREDYKRRTNKFAGMGRMEAVAARMHQNNESFDEAMLNVGFTKKQLDTFKDAPDSVERATSGKVKAVEVLQADLWGRLLGATDTEFRIEPSQEQQEDTRAALQQLVPQSPIMQEQAAGSAQAPGFDFQSQAPQMEQNVQPASIEQQALEQAIASGIPPTGEAIQRIAGTLREGRRRELVPEAQRILQNSGQEVTPERLDRLIQFLIRQSGEPQ